METYVAMLRAINLGSRNRISMPDLRQLFEALGAEDTQTYVQSGNVVFRSRVGDAGKLRRSIERAIAEELGLDVTVLLRTNEQLGAVVKANPFVGGGRDASKLHAMFLDRKPDAASARALDDVDAGRDEVAVKGEVVYLHCPDGYGRSRLNNAFLEKKLGVAGTTRNWRTVTSLDELSGRLA